MAIGYIPISRKIFEHEFWNERRPFSRFEAWLDLLQSARFQKKPKTDILGGKKVTWKRGQLPCSYRFLMERWQWKSITKVETFLKSLQKQGMIEVLKTQGQNIVSICKYEDYNLLKEEQETPQGQTTPSEPAASAVLEDNEEEGQQKGQGIGQEIGQSTDSVSETYEPPKDSKKDGEKDSKKDETNNTLIKKINLHQSAIDAFCQNYILKFKTTYIFKGGKDAKAISNILEYLKKKIKDKNEDATDERVLNGFNYFIENITDSWILDNYSPSLLDSKFNEIYMKSLNAKKGNNGSGGAAVPKAKSITEAIKRQEAAQWR